jgi:hypothetical protein
MSKVWRQTFGVWQEDRERDERYQRLMQVRRPGSSSGTENGCCNNWGTPLRGWQPVSSMPAGSSQCGPTPAASSQALGFVDLPTLMGGPVEPDASLLAMAQARSCTFSGLVLPLGPITWARCLSRWSRGSCSSPPRALLPPAG